MEFGCIGILAHFTQQCHLDIEQGLLFQGDPTAALEFALRFFLPTSMNSGLPMNLALREVRVAGEGVDITLFSSASCQEFEPEGHNCLRLGQGCGCGPRVTERKPDPWEGGELLSLLSVRTQCPVFEVCSPWEPFFITSLRLKCLTALYSIGRLRLQNRPLEF